MGIPNKQKDTKPDLQVVFGLEATAVAHKRQNRIREQAVQETNDQLGCAPAKGGLGRQQCRDAACKRALHELSIERVQQP